MNNTINGPRLTKLSKALEKAAGLSSKRASLNIFLNCFPFANNNPEIIKFLSIIYEEMQQQLVAQVETNVFNICKEQQVDIKLNELDRLIVQEKTLQELGVNDISLSNECPFIEVQKETMEIKQEELKWIQDSIIKQQELNNTINKQIQEKQDKLLQILDKLNFQYDKFINASKYFNEYNIQPMDIEI